jgi:NitT/TauT family transport system substrate-binding protein
MFSITSSNPSNKKMVNSRPAFGKMRLGVPDLISNSYFPAVAAVELGFFAREGLDVSLELIFPVSRCYEALRDGQVQFVGGAAHAVLAAFPEWRGAKLIAAQSQGMYWFLVMRSDLGIAHGELNALKGRRIGAAPWVDMGLRQFLSDSGCDLQRDAIEVTGIPFNPVIGPNFGLAAAKALEDGLIDGFWANGMGAEIAVTSGIGCIVLDARRDSDNNHGFGYTFASIATTDGLIKNEPTKVAAAVRAIAATQRALRANKNLAADVGRKLFPAREAALIADVVERDLPYYDPSITPYVVDQLNRFCRMQGLLQSNAGFDAVVERSIEPFWRMD